MLDLKCWLHVRRTVRPHTHNHEQFEVVVNNTIKNQKRQVCWSRKHHPHLSTILTYRRYHIWHSTVAPIRLQACSRKEIAKRHQN